MELNDEQRDISRRKIDEFSKALNATRFRGHDLGFFSEVRSEAGQVFHDARCVLCGRDLRITPEPQPNQIFASGSALALNCEDNHEND